MIKAEMRRVAIGAARSEMRRMGVDPSTQSQQDALLVLDDLARLHPELIASYWYQNASDAQRRLFDREWRRWKMTHAF